MIFLFLAKYIDWNFSTLKLSPIELNHKTRTTSSFWRITKSATDSIKLKIFKSSANIRNLESGITNLRPLTNKENNYGDKCLPLEEHLKVHRLLQIYILRL